MSLIRCPECQTEISDQALTCPKCGYVLKQIVTRHEQITNMSAVGMLLGILVVSGIAFKVFDATGSIEAFVIVMVVGVGVLFAMTTVRK